MTGEDEASDLRKRLAAALAENQRLTAELARCRDWTDDDKPLAEDEAIRAVHPVRSGNHERYAEAARLVGAKRSKYALVDLVNWLLSRASALWLPCGVCRRTAPPRPDEEVKSFSCGTCGFALPSGTRSVDRG